MELELQIKRLMRERGMQTKDLAEIMGKSSQYVSNIINGGKGVSVNTLIDVAKALNVEFWQLTAPENVKKVSETNQEVQPALITCPHCGKELKLTKA